LASDKNLEKMDDFFNLRADNYDVHMKKTIKSFDLFYKMISKPIPKTQEQIKVLDLGCGTGLEIEGIFAKAPAAKIVGIDMSEKMLDKIREKYQDKADQLELIFGSYLEKPFKNNAFDYIVSVMTIHHLTYKEKLELYKKIHSALKENGIYIEGDYIVPKEKEKMMLSNYFDLLKKDEGVKNGGRHIDIPFSITTEKKVMLEAGFSAFDVIWNEGSAAIYVSKK
jgi:tRNA (cmo5U34)-methyltransferase